jgi:hypothetical protein
MNDMNAKRDLLLVGSVGLKSAEEVFRTAADALGTRLHAIPDGETGDRAVWVIWNRAAYDACDALEPDPAEVAAGGRITSATEGIRKWGGGDQLEQGKQPPPRLRVKPGVDPAAIAFGPLGYLQTTLESWETFRRLRDEGAIPAGTRFQVSLPTVAASMNAHIEPRSHEAVEPVLERRLFEEVAEICAAIPHEDLALQWDVSTEMGQVEEVRAHWFPDPLQGATDRLARHCEQVPAGVELGIHLCYGSYGNRHWKEPDDLGNCVRVFNTLAAKVSRPIHWVHMPVPIERDDEAFYAPLRDLKLPPGAKLYLGLIHLRDGVEGARRRMAMADNFAVGYGIAAECGFGRRPPETIPELLRVHAEA